MTLCPVTFVRGLTQVDTPVPELEQFFGKFSKSCRNYTDGAVGRYGQSQQKQILSELIYVAGIGCAIDKSVGATADLSNQSHPEGKSNEQDFARNRHLVLPPEQNLTDTYCAAYEDAAVEREENSVVTNSATKDDAPFGSLQRLNVAYKRVLLRLLDRPATRF